MNLGKKGTIEDGIFWIFRILMIMFVVVLVIFFVNSVIARHLDSEDLELYLISARMINSPSCLALEKSIDVYEDEVYNIKRVYPGVINLEHYNEKYLNQSCLVDIEKPDVGIKLELNGTKPVFINQEYYEDIEPLTFSTKYYKIEKNFIVEVIDKDLKTTTNTIKIVVVAKKR